MTIPASRKVARRFPLRTALRAVPGFLGVIATVAICRPTSADAQEPAVLTVASATSSVIEYATNESGGRIRISAVSADSVTIEAIRVELLENAAAIRRGDFGKVAVIQTSSPAVQVLAMRRGAIRCTFRFTPRGGELVLLSDDDAVVAAIHQLLAAEPPRMSRT